MSKSPKHILLVGAGGMLAWDLRAAIAHRFPNAKLSALGRSELDISRLDAIETAFARYTPDWVVNAAAYTNVDAAESERELAEAVNARGPEWLARACSRQGALLTHFSTDQVFDGKSDRPRTEADEPAPVNHYGRTKLKGEQAVLRHAADCLVLRVQWLYGERKDRFTPLKQKSHFAPFADQFGAPTWTREVARAVCELYAQDVRGLYHFAYDDYASWAEVFAFVQEQWGLDSLRLQPRSTADAALPARRPLFSVLSNSKIKPFLPGGMLASWKGPLREFLTAVAFKGQVT